MLFNKKSIVTSLLFSKYCNKQILFVIYMINKESVYMFFVYMINIENIVESYVKGHNFYKKKKKIYKISIKYRLI